MAKLFFYYGPSNSSKTVHAQATVYNYYDNRMKPLLVKPQMAGGEPDMLESKPGIALSCIYMEQLCKMTDNDIKGYDIIVVDAAHFLSAQQVKRLTYIVDELNIPVVCYGLRTDYNGNLFLGSRELFACADSIEEIRTICWCGKKAIYNARIDDEGEMVCGSTSLDMDTKYRYQPLCRKHYKAKLLGKY